MAIQNTTFLGSFLGREMGPLLSGKSRLVKRKYYDLARVCIFPLYTANSRGHLVIAHFKRIAGIPFTVDVDKLFIEKW